MRIHRSLKKTIASSLIALMGFQIASGLTHEVRAGSPRTADINYTLSFDIPNHGVIDLYHNAYSGSDHVSNSLYILRNTAIEDLLNTRRSLKILLGGTQRARRVSGKSDLGFDVPAGVIDLYLLGNLGRGSVEYNDSGAADEPENSTEAVLPGPVQARHGVDTDSIPEIATAIHWLGGNEPQYDEALRARVLIGLAQVAAQIVKYDQQLKFVEKDFWSDRRIDREFHEQEIAPWEQAVVRGGGEVGAAHSTMVDQLKRDWMNRHGMGDILAALAGHREYLLNRYHLLGIEVDGKALYRHIYEAMQGVGFPRADMVQEVVTPHLPAGAAPIPLPAQFDQAVERAFQLMAGEHRNQMLSELNLAANPKIDKALILSLEANTGRLRELTSAIDYDGSRSSPLLALGRYDDLWEAAQNKYQYLGGIVDFNAARQQIRSHFQGRDSTHRQARYAAVGLGVGVGVAALVFSGGGAAAGSMLGLPLKTWLVSAGLMVSASPATYSYVESTRASSVAKGLYLGTAQSGTQQGMRDALQMEHEDFVLLISSLVAVGWESRAITMAVARPLVTVAGKTFVRISAQELAYLRQTVTALGARAEALAPLGRALMATLRGLLGMTAGSEAVMTLDAAVPIVARQLRVAPAAVWARLEQNAAVGALVKGWRVRDMSAKIMMKPSFLRTMMSQQVNNAVVTVGTQYLARGDRMFNEEFSDLVTGVGQGVLVTALMVWIGAPIAPEARATVLGADARVKVQGGFWGSNTGQFLNRGFQNFLVGMTANGLWTGASEGIQFTRHQGQAGQPTAQERAINVGRDALYGGLFTGISSSSRYQFFSWLEGVIARKVANDKTAKILIQGAWTGNNIFGGWSYVKIGQLTGFLKESGSSTDVDWSNPDANHPLDHSITGMQIKEVGNAFFRVEGDPTLSEYMFDFLQSGAAAGPPPILR